MMSWEPAFLGLVSACVPQKPGVRHTTGSVVLVELVDVDEVVLLDVLELVELLVLLDVLLVLLEVLLDVLLEVLLDVLELVEVLELVDVLVVVVTTSVPSTFSDRNGSSMGASCSAPCWRSSRGPDWSPARTSATASATPGLTFRVHICVPPIGVGGVPAGRSKLVVSEIGFAKSGIPSAPGQ